MKKLFSENLTRWLLPLVLACYILAFLSIPPAVRVTYAGRQEAAKHVLTYMPGKLRWDSSTGIDPETGSARLSIFDARSREDGTKLVAPGDEGFNIVRLHNYSAAGSVSYTAVLYCIQSNDMLPVTVSMSAQGGTETDRYPLPPGVEEAQVFQAITGEVAFDQIVDLDISWSWEFYESEEQDAVDTWLADQGDSLTVGVYIVVEDDNRYINPRTGEDIALDGYAVLMLISGAMLILLFLGQRKQEKWEEAWEQSGLEES